MTLAVRCCQLKSKFMHEVLDATRIVTDVLGFALSSASDRAVPSVDPFPYSSSNNRLAGWIYFGATWSETSTLSLVPPSIASLSF